MHRPGPVSAAAVALALLTATAVLGAVEVATAPAAYARCTVNTSTGTITCQDESYYMDITAYDPPLLPAEPPIDWPPLNPPPNDTGGDPPIIEVKVVDGTFPGIGPGNAACSKVVGTPAAPDLNQVNIKVNWSGNTSGGVPAWRLEFYHGSYPIDIGLNRDEWHRVDGSGNASPNETYVVQPSDAGEGGLINWRVCVSNLGTTNVNGTWRIESDVTFK